MNLLTNLSLTITLLSAFSMAKKFPDRYSLAQELYQLNMKNITTWVCIIGQASDYDTGRYVRNGQNISVGLFQFHNPTGCKQFRNADNIDFPCTTLLDDDITDDVILAKQILEQYSWTAWGLHYEICKNAQMVPDDVWDSSS